MRHIAAALASAGLPMTDPDRHLSGVSDAELAPLTKPWPRLRDQGVEWTDAHRATARSGIRVIRLSRFQR